MKTPYSAGDWAFKALLKNGNGWKLTKERYFSLEEAQTFNEGYEIKWPVEVIDNEAVYIPSPEELV